MVFGHRIKTTQHKNNVFISSKTDIITTYAGIKKLIIPSYSHRLSDICKTVTYGWLIYNGGCRFFGYASYGIAIN